MIEVHVPLGLQETVPEGSDELNAVCACANGTRPAVRHRAAISE